MNSFSIRDIENMSGIKAHTLRVWEQRYNILRPKRKESNHRFYDNNDLKHILRISWLYHNGYKISKIASLDEEQIKEITLRNKSTNPYDLFISQLTEASIDFDQERFEKIFHNIVLYFGFEKSLLQVVYPFLDRIGKLWMTGNIIPAQEHFASCIIRKKMILAIDGLEMPPHKAKDRVIIFSPSEEEHELPLLLMQYLLKKSGIPLVYLGASRPLKEVKYYIQHKQVTHIYCNIITNFTEWHLNELTGQLCNNFPEQKIVIAGPAVKAITCNISNLRLLRSLEEVIEFGRGNRL